MVYTKDYLINRFKSFIIIYNILSNTGYIDCSDKSDEDVSLCREYSCPDHTYRCSYGGCVHQEVLCDGIKDCFDGTDEDPSICGAINCDGIECPRYECRSIISRYFS